MSTLDPTTVGRSVARPEAFDKLTGREQYVGDMVLPGMLHGAVVRSTRPHARIKCLRAEKAATMPGVVAILTARNIPGENVIPVVLRDQPCLARDVVRYVGEPVALVAAVTVRQARAAAAMVEIEYEDLPAVFDPLEARRHPSVHVFGTDNIFRHLDVIRGNAAQAFSECAVVVKRTYHTPPQEHVYLEPQGMLAVPAPGGVMQVYGSMQCPFYVREAVATVLGLPLARVQVVQTTTGGGFGGKEDVPSLPAAQAALLAWHTRRPVKLIYEREEDIICTSKRHAAWIQAKHGARADGTLHAVEIEYVIDGGAYATLSPIVLFRGIVHAVGPYRCPHVRISADAVATNHVPSGAFRGFGSPQVLFAAERQMDELARALCMDPVEPVSYTHLRA
ncbi:MAG: molybdopterin-dependent oxidoreductase, partial [bacterium]|nr:molybdopterin-dependent oxidoreductase [bacterium]